MRGGGRPYGVRGGKGRVVVRVGGATVCWRAAACSRYRFSPKVTSVFKASVGPVGRALRNTVATERASDRVAVNALRRVDGHPLAARAHRHTGLLPARQGVWHQTRPPIRSMVLASSRKCNPARGTRVTPPDSPEVTWLRSDWTSYARLTMWFVLDESDHSAADHFARRRGAAGVLQESLGAYAGRTTLRPEWLVLRLTHAVATGSSACRSGHHAVDTKQGGCFGPRRGHCSGHWGAFAVCGVGPP